MRMGVIIAGLLVAVGLAGPAAAQQVIDEPGRIAHAAAETSFPVQLGSFRRTSVVRYDPRGADMSASYGLNQGGDRMVITVYLYPPTQAGRDQQACRSEFDGALQAIHSQQRGARIVERTAVPSVAGRPNGFARAATLGFTANFSGEVQDVHSGLYLYCFVGADSWMVKYRVTYNASFENAAGLIDWFVRTGPWPGREPADSIAARSAVASPRA
jgi:hypothetical protein